MAASAAVTAHGHCDSREQGGGHGLQQKRAAEGQCRTLVRWTAAERANVDAWQVGSSRQGRSRTHGRRAAADKGNVGHLSSGQQPTRAVPDAWQVGSSSQGRRQVLCRWAAADIGGAIIRHLAGGQQKTEAGGWRRTQSARCYPAWLAADHRAMVAVVLKQCCFVCSAARPLSR